MYALYTYNKHNRSFFGLPELVGFTNNLKENFRLLMVQAICLAFYESCPCHVDFQAYEYFVAPRYDIFDDVVLCHQRSGISPDSFSFYNKLPWFQAHQKQRKLDWPGLTDTYRCW